MAVFQELREKLAATIQRHAASLNADR